MDSSNEVKNLLKENYLKVKQLIRAKDPDDNPYKSQYEAKELLNEMKNFLEQIEDKENDIRECAKLAGVYFLLGTVFMATDENASAEDHLLKCYKMIEDSSDHADNILCATACLNQIGLLYARSLKNEDALSFLHKSAEIYKSFTSKESDEEPVTFLTMFTDTSPKTEKYGFVILEKTHTLTLYYLAQVYTAMDRRDEGAMYCFKTLRRQIESNDFEPIEWSVNCATMSQFLVEKNAFKEARHHLAAATFVLDQHLSELLNKETPLESEELEAKKEEISRRRSDVLRCWVKYCIMLLAFSKDRLTADGDGPEIELPSKELVGLSFPSLSDSLKEDVVTCDPLLTFDDARPVFLFGQKCCNEATNYYTLTEHASDYTNICLDHSQLYLGLAFFEDDEDRQCKMLKRRLDLLSNVIKSLNPNYYLDVCREIWMSLGQICSDMVGLKLMKIRLTGESPNTQKLMKINALVEDGVNHYTSFIKSFIDRRTNKMPTDYPKDHEQTIILANLYAARLYSKYVRPDKAKSIEIDKKSMEFYQSIVDYARSHKDVAKEMSAEVKIADDMLLLLPYKITRLSEFAN
ncbi:hypothetical protein O3M35_007282 [Rhynocoris fuscipes]|uniref:KIF-binding protein n=1 Tax=Rhynocoris fuscipes TaxID=488301 RepID=A0AAW1DBJ6_9HEMI